MTTQRHSFELGRFSETKARNLQAKIDGKTYMMFDVCVAPYMGEFVVTVTSTHCCTQDDFVDHLVYFMATLL